MNGRSLNVDDRGATTVEFALVVPVLILILLACLDFGRAVNAYVTVSSATREGARYATVHPNDDPAAFRDAVRAYVVTRMAPLATDAAVLDVNAVYVPTADDRWATGAPHPGTVTVDIRYRWDAATSVTGSFFAASSGSRWFEFSSTMETIR